MHKVVFNNCYGGFSLSKEAVDWLETNCKDDELRKFIKATRNKILPSPSNNILCYGVSEYFDDNRHHKDLVAVVEVLGDKASGKCACLRTTTIYGNQYRIDEYDGAEEVITPDDSHRWIFIND